MKYRRARLKSTGAILEWQMGSGADTFSVSEETCAQDIATGFRLPVNDIDFFYVDAERDIVFSDGAVKPPPEPPTQRDLDRATITQAIADPATPPALKAAMRLLLGRG